MSEQDIGGQAFPHTAEYEWCSPDQIEGMTLLDYFAGQAGNKEVNKHIDGLSDCELAIYVGGNSAEMIPYIKTASARTRIANFFLRAEWEAQLRARLRFIDAAAMVAEKRRLEQ